MLGEANTRHNLVGDHNECQDLYWHLNVRLEALVKLMVSLVLILPHIVGSNMEIIRFFPAIEFLFSLLPYLIDGVNSLLYY